MKKHKPIKWISVVLIAVVSLTLFSGCVRTKFGSSQQAQTQEDANLTFYGLFDSEEVYEPIIEAYESQNPNVNLTYKKFTDPDAYLDLIINELAEGEGPDIFMMHNSWLPKHYKKLTPAPETAVNTEIFRSLFVDVASEDLIIPNEAGQEQVWGIPLYVDTLALYYNDDHIEEAIPSRGTPGDTWEEIADDVTQLNKEDQSFSRFERAGIAMGRSDNILRAFDILMSIMLQYKVDFYSEDLTEVAFDLDSNAATALSLYASFALPSQQNYSWNSYLADADSAEKELETFALGEVSMIMGYSYTYEDLKTVINSLQAQGEDTIKVSDIKIQETPQVYDPSTSAETREAYASYFFPVVSRTTENSDAAWSFLANMVDEENLSYYNEKTHRPSALRSLIESQKADPTYGVFAAQVGYASSISMADAEKYEDIFLDGIDSILSTARSTDVLNNIADQIQALIPDEGIKPTYISTE
jgi:ABC-type glycerol-3-phosphate transport system substrate-binding protein